MRIILTGATGFLGSVIQSELSEHDFVTLGRSNADILVDLTKTVPQLQTADMVIHAAGKAHILPKTTTEKQDFYEVNVTGTKHLLESLKSMPSMPRFFVFVSTVAVYGLESGHMVNEGKPLKAADPYGHSKILAENLIQRWCSQHGVVCTILRLPLVAGKNPPGNLHSMINGIEKGYYFNVAGGTARKSVVLASDVAKIIPKAASIGGIYNLTDTVHPSFSQLSVLIAKQLKMRSPLSIPKWLAQALAKMGDVLGKNAPINTIKLEKILSDLTFDDARASSILDWKPTSVINGFKIK